MKLLDQILSDDTYTVRIWADELGADAVYSYVWQAAIPSGLLKADYEKQQVTEALRLAATNLPVVSTPVIIQESIPNITALETAVALEKTNAQVVI